MSPDAQAAADAAMVEMIEQMNLDETLSGRNLRWMNRFLANFFDEWLTKIGGEQVCSDQGVRLGQAVEEQHSSDTPAKPATPIDTEALSEAIEEAIEEWDGCGCCSWPPQDKTRRGEVKRILDEAIGGRAVAECEWREERVTFFWKTGCSREWEGEAGPPSYYGYTFCPYCGKTIREVPYEEEASDEQG